MRVLCRHGHIAFYPRNASDVAKFAFYYEVELVRERDYYTFSFLKDAPRYSLPGKAFLNLPAIVNFEGEPWDVMRENGFVYDISKGLLVLKSSVLIQIEPKLTGFYFLAQSPLIQPGSRNSIGQQILSYSGEYNLESRELRISEYEYE